MSVKTKPITITLPVDLLAWIDELAKQDLETRSDVLRRAALAYVRGSSIRDSNFDMAEASAVLARQESREQESERHYDYAVLGKKYPYAVGDHELLRFLDDHDSDRL